MSSNATKERAERDRLKLHASRILKMIGISAAISLYGALYLQTAMTKFGATLNPIRQIQCCLKFGFPVLSFSVLFLFVLLGTSYFAMLRFKETEGRDPLGRLFSTATERKSYGEAHFEEPGEYKDVALVQSPEKAMGTIFGQLDDSGKKLINFRINENNRLNRHICVVASSGKGKTYSFSKPYCYQVVKRRESIIITDPDGGLYRDMAGYFMDQNYVVRRLDLKNFEKSDGWDCLKCISRESPAQAEIDATMFSKIVIENSVDNMESIYATGPMSLLKALILRVVLGDDIREEDKNIKTVYSYLQNPGGEDFLDQLFDERLLNARTRICRGGYMAFKQSSPNLRGNIIANLAINLQIFQSDMICDVLSSDDIDLELPGKLPCAYFCIFPDTHDTYQFVVSLFFSMLFIKLNHFADHQASGKLPVPVNFLLEELPSIGIIPNFDRLMSTVRKRRIMVAMVCQDLTQFQNLYKNSWQTILGACDTVVSLGVNDMESAKYISSRTGSTTVKIESKRGDAMERLVPIFTDHTIGEGRRDLLMPSEVLKVDVNDVLIIFTTHNPVIAKKYPYTMHPDAKKLRTIQLEEIPDLYDEEGRRNRRKAERVQLERYYANHPLMYDAEINVEEEEGEEEETAEIWNPWPGQEVFMEEDVIFMDEDMEYETMTFDFAPPTPEEDPSELADELPQDDEGSETGQIEAEKERQEAIVDKAKAERSRRDPILDKSRELADKFKFASPSRGTAISNKPPKKK